MTASLQNTQTQEPAPFHPSAQPAGSITVTGCPLAGERSPGSPAALSNTLMVCGADDVIGRAWAGDNNPMGVE